MRKNDYIIRLETPADYPEVENLARESFWNVYRPGCFEHYLLHTMRDHEDFIHELSFVMLQDGRIIGQNVFVHAHIDADDGRKIPILTMGPICIAPDRKRMGYGKALLEYSLSKAREWGAGALCFEGNIGFYGTCGFDYASRFHIRYHGLSENDDASFFLCKELKPGYLSGVTGVYAPPPPYNIDPAEALAFDAAFPPKERLILPGQLG